jgi:hypothetical protein
MRCAYCGTGLIQLLGKVSFDRDSYLVWIKRELSVGFIKGNAWLFRRYVGFRTHGVGQRFIPGGALPLSDV